MNKTVYYATCSNGTIDIVVNVNGVDKDNSNYRNLDIVKEDYPISDGWEYVEMQ